MNTIFKAADMLHHFNHKATKHIEAVRFKVLSTHTWMFLLSWCACEVRMNFELDILRSLSRTVHSMPFKSML